jgi:DnaJ-class molecular chaperone
VILKSDYTFYQITLKPFYFYFGQILGSDSGWQSVPLTDLITAAAVKKAYRKATLCVHPDKLQQRGATIRQKYICEKVFDLLKVCLLLTPFA